MHVWGTVLTVLIISGCRGCRAGMEPRPYGKAGRTDACTGDGSCIVLLGWCLDCFGALRLTITMCIHTMANESNSCMSS